jgi:predicted ATPase
MNQIYEKKVFFFSNLGFINNTEARKISFEEALKFEEIHRDAYQQFGYNLLTVEAASVEERYDFILQNL